MRTKIRRIAPIIGALILSSAIWNLAHPPQSAQAEEDQEEVQSNDQKFDPDKETWMGAGSITNVSLITVGDHAYSRVRTTEATFWVDGFLSWHQNDKVRISKHGWLDLEKQNQYYKVMGD